MSTDFWGDWGDDNDGDDDDDDSGEMDFDDDDVTEEEELALSANSYSNEFLIVNAVGYNLIKILNDGLELFVDIETNIYDLDEDGRFKIIGFDIVDERW